MHRLRLESGVLLPGESSSESTEWLAGLSVELQGLMLNPERPISAAWAYSILQHRQHNPLFQKQLRAFHYMFPEVTPSEAQRRFLSAEQAVLLSSQQDEEASQLELPPYPSGDYTNPQTWLRAYAQINKTFPFANRYYWYLKKDLATSVSQRMVVVRFLGRALSHLIGDEPVWASCGCGDMAGDRRNWLSERNSKFQFDTVAVRQALGSRVISEYKSDIFNQIVSEPSDTKRVVGIDKEDPNDPTNIAWARACPTPEELWSGRWSEMHDALLREYVPPEWLGFRQGDLSRRADMQKGVVDAEGGQLDAFSALFSWYQGTASIRWRKLTNMREVLTKAAGLGVIVDFAKADASGTRLTPYQTWMWPNVYVAYKGMLHRVLSSSNGRLGGVWVFPKLAQLARGGPHYQDVRKLLD